MDINLKEYVLDILRHGEPYSMDGIALTLKERNVQFNDKDLIAIVETLVKADKILKHETFSGEILYMLATDRTRKLYKGFQYPERYKMQRYSLTQKDKLQIAKIRGELRNIERMLGGVDDNLVRNTLNSLIAILEELTKVTPTTTIAEKRDGIVMLMEKQIIEPLPPGKSPISGTIMSSYINEKLRTLKEMLPYLSRENYIIGEIVW